MQSEDSEHNGIQTSSDSLDSLKEFTIDSTADVAVVPSTLTTPSVAVQPTLDDDATITAESILIDSASVLTVPTNKNPNMNLQIEIASEEPSVH